MYDPIFRIETQKLSPRKEYRVSRKRRAQQLQMLLISRQYFWDTEIGQLVKRF